MSTAVEAFKEHWDHIHEMTVEFAAALPDAAWRSHLMRASRPSPSSFGMSSVCAASTTTASRQGEQTFHVSMSTTPSDLTREALAAGLEEQRRELAAILEDADRLEAPAFAVDLMGAELGFAAFTYVMVQHEAIHHGEWSLYAAQSGFPVPSLWTVQWGLGPGTKA